MEGPDLKFVETVIDNGAHGTHTVRFEAGLLARQADGSAVVYIDGDTMLLSTTVAQKTPRDSIDFFPLTVDVEERMYAAGRIPGSFFRREGRPSEGAILTCRLIDRPLRPSFVKGLRNEVQVIVTVMALNPNVLYDVVAINAASMSTQIAGLPFSGPIGGVRVALIGDQWVAFPTVKQLEDATFDMVVAGRVLPDGDVAIMMVEAESTEATWDLVRSGRTAPTEEVVGQGLEAAKPFIKQLCDAQAELAAQLPKETYDFPVFKEYSDDVFAAVEEIGRRRPRPGDADRRQAGASAGRRRAQGPGQGRTRAPVRGSRGRDQRCVQGAHQEDRAPPHPHRAGAHRRTRRARHPHAVGRGRRGAPGARLGAVPARRDPDPRRHHLNMLDMEQKLDTLAPETTKRYMHNYNFPPYSTGETGRVGSPKRREVGHGALAERALVPVLPKRDEFPYAIRQVSEALGSNGSTSMGSVCASTLSLLEAGVPLKSPVAGIAMGLMSETIDGQTQYVTLTDILGDEDALGDMDFKVAGTKDFVTALQLDTKLNGIPADELAKAMLQAREARYTLLEVMGEAIEGPDEMSPFAPRIITVKIPVDKIGEVIGPKGKVINQIQDDTGANISIEDDGTIYIGADNGEAAEAARALVNAIANPQMPERGERYLGTVVKLTTFGAFVSLMPGKDGLLHISKLKQLNNNQRVENVEDVLSVGQKLQVEISDIDDRGKLSLIPVTEEPAAQA